MKKDDARLAVLHEYDRWAKAHPSKAREMGGFVFFRYLEKEKPDLLDFRGGAPANGKSFTCGFVTEVDWKIKAFAIEHALGNKAVEPYLVQLLSSSESMDMNSSASLDFGSTCSNPSINLKYSGPSLSISASACLVSISAVLVSFG
jgi:hypothetical protein